MPPIRKSTDLSDVEKGGMLGMHLGGMSTKEIALHFKRPRNVVSKYLDQALVENPMDQLRAQGPSVRDRRCMAASLKKHPSMTYAERIETTGIRMSVKEIKELKKELGLDHKMPARTRPNVTPEQAAARLKWCKDKRLWTAEQWRNVMWSGESCVERGGNKTQWVYQRADDPTPVYADPPEFPLMRIRVAAMFWGENQRSKLFLKNGANTAAYKTLLEEMLLPTYKPEDGLLFMHDNAPTHKAKTITDLLAEKQITCLEWPPKSTDLNPFQYIWESFKTLAAKKSPQKWRIKGRSEKGRAELEEYLK